MEICLAQRLYKVIERPDTYIEVGLLAVKEEGFFRFVSIFEDGKNSLIYKRFGNKKQVYATSAKEAWRKVTKVANREAKSLAEFFGYLGGVEKYCEFKSEILNQGR